MKDHKYITLERIIKNGVVNFGRNIWLAIADMAMMTITLTILLFAVIANATFSHTVDNLLSHIDVSFYLKDNISNQQRLKLENEVRHLPNVKSVSYTSKQQALKNYVADNANNSDLLAAISQTDNPLPASLTIKPLDPNKLQDIQDFLERPAQTAQDEDLLLLARVQDVPHGD